MKKIILFGILIISAMLALNKNSEEEQVRVQRASLLKDEILKDIGGRKPYWQDFEFEHNSDSDFNFVITYNKNKGSQNLAKNETEQIVRIALKRLLAEGRKPTEDLTFINVTAFQDAGKGEIGEPLVRNLGTARYNMNTDQIEFNLP